MISILLFIIFLILKLCNVISWEWVYICIPLLVIGLILIISVFFKLMYNMLSGIKFDKNK